MHIIHYSKTRNTYIAYQKSRKKKAFFYEHREEIEKHEAAKELYEEFKESRKTMIDYQTAKDNVDRILGITSLKKEQEKTKEPHR